MTRFSEDRSSGKASHDNDKLRDNQYEHKTIGGQLVAKYDKIISVRFLCRWFIEFMFDVGAALLADSHLEPLILPHCIIALCISI